MGPLPVSDSPIDQLDPDSAPVVELWKGDSRAVVDAPGSPSGQYEWWAEQGYAEREDRAGLLRPLFTVRG